MTNNDVLKALSDFLNFAVQHYLSYLPFFAGDAYEPVVFEFLISSTLLRDTLKDVVEEYGIPTVSFFRGLHLCIMFIIVKL